MPVGLAHTPAEKLMPTAANATRFPQRLAAAALILAPALALADAPVPNKGELWGVTGLKRLIKADDSLDVFGIHAVGGIFGALMTGIFNAPALGGPGSTVDWVKGTSGYPGIAKQFFIQLMAVCLVLVWTAAVAFAAFLIVKLVVGLRVPEEEEREGLDITSHGERAYDL
jgi:Amt family ammonium transporter